MLLKKIILFLVFTSILTACSTPPKHKPQLNAEQLAKRELQNFTTPVAQPPVGLPIAELPRPQIQPLKELNQIGQIPPITTLTEKTPSDIELNLLNDENASVHLDFEQGELRNIIEFIAEALKISLLIDPTIGNHKVTIRTDEEKPLKKKDLWSLLQLLLNDAGITMEKKGNVYHLKKSAAKLPGTIGIAPSALIRSDSPEVLQITPLRYITAESAQAAINPLIQPKGHVIILPTLNIIGITTTPQRLQRVNKLLSIIDADPFLHRGMRLFRLSNSKASEVQTELDKILKAIYGKAPPAYQAIALERINAILVIAPPNSGFNEVALWLEILDEVSEESNEQVFIYKVKNLEADKLASTLSNVFKVEDKKAAKEKEKIKKRDKKKKELLKPVTAGGTGAISAELNVTIVADESTNSLLIRATPRDYQQLLETIRVLDRVPKEVMINVIIAEVSLTEATRFGIDWTALFSGKYERSIGSNLEVPTGNFPANVNPTNDNNVTSIGGLSGFSINYMGDFLSGSLSALLNYVSSKNDISILARPSILVRNNEDALINVGSNEPFLSGINTSGINNQMLSNDVQYKDTGITVKVTPRINDDGIINMKINSELTLLGPPRTTQQLQSFDQRKIETVVTVRDKTAIVIGGLIQTNNNDNKQGIPMLQDLPIFGNTLFSSTNIEEKRTELVLIIVPQIVNPEADNRPMTQKFRHDMQQLWQMLNEQQFFLE